MSKEGNLVFSSNLGIAGGRDARTAVLWDWLFVYNLLPTDSSGTIIDWQDLFW